jgi:short-subunit dehydrogenase
VASENGESRTPDDVSITCLNVFSLFRLTQLAAAHMAKAVGGCVLNISSMAGENKNVCMSSYASSKAAVNQPHAQHRL